MISNFVDVITTLLSYYDARYTLMKFPNFSLNTHNIYIRKCSETRVYHCTLNDRNIPEE